MKEAQVIKSVQKAIVSMAKSLKMMAKVQKKMDKRITDAEMNSNLVKVDVNRVSAIIKEFQLLEQKLTKKGATKWSSPLRAALENTIGTKISPLK